MNRERWVIALILIAVACGSCSIGMRKPPSWEQRRFCDVGYLVRKGEYLGRVGIRMSDGTLRVMPLLAGDSVCLHAPPEPFRPDTPTVATRGVST